MSTDGWTNPQRRPFINFMVTFEGAPVFLKAIDGTKEYKDKYCISELLVNVIKEIGPEKVVQVITDNAYVMKAAGSRGGHLSVKTDPPDKSGRPNHPPVRP